MVYKDLCQIKTLAFRVAFTGSVHENLSLFTKSQGRFNRSLPFSCFVLRTVLHGIQGFVSNESFDLRLLFPDNDLVLHGGFYYLHYIDLWRLICASPGDWDLLKPLWSICYDFIPKITKKM